MVKHEDICVISHCHRQINAFNEMTAATFIKYGYPLFIHDTSGRRLIDVPEGAMLLDAESHLGYDGAMVNIKREFQHTYKYMVFVDNDMFMSEINHFEMYLQEFIDRDFDFACHFEYPGYTEFAEKDKKIWHVPNPKTSPDTDIKPYPHWENSLMIIRTELYNQLSEDNVSHGRRWLHAMNQLGAKMGGHECEYRLRYTHFGPQWFHMGNLMGCYGKIEHGQFNEFDVNSKVESSRLGFMYLDNPTMPGLDQAIAIYGKDRCLNDWMELAEGTCMDFWKIERKLP